MVKIDLKALKAGIHEYDWVLTAETLEVDPEVFGGEIELYVRLDYHASRVLVSIQIDTVARLVCDRTLVDYEQPVQGEYNLLFSGPEMFEGMEEDEEDIRLLPPDVEEIDLDDGESKEEQEDDAPVPENQRCWVCQFGWTQGASFDGGSGVLPRI